MDPALAPAAPQQGPPPGVTLAPPIPQPPPGVTLAPPSAAAAPPTPPPAPTPAAATPAATPASAWQRLKDTVKSNIESNLADTGGGPIGDISRGAFKGVLGTAGGLIKLGSNVAGDLGGKSNVQDFMDTHPGSTFQEAVTAVNNPAGGQKPYTSAEHQQHVDRIQQAAKWFTDNSNTNGFWEGLGSAGESVAELMGGEGLFKLSAELAGGEKAVGIADKLKQTEKVATFLKNNPKVAKLMALGMRTAHAAAQAGGMSAAQTYVKSGGDADQTETAGLLGAAGGAIISPALEGVSSLAKHLMPETATIAGQEVPILRSQIIKTAEDGTPIRPSALQEIAANRSNSPEAAGQQEAAGARTVQQEAQGVLQRELNAANASRTAEAAARPGEAAAAQAGTEAAEGAAPGSAPAAAAPGAPVDTSEPALGPGSGLSVVRPTEVSGTPLTDPRLGDGEAGLASPTRGSVEDLSSPALEAGDGADLARQGEPAAGAPAGAIGDGRTAPQYSAEDTSRPGLGGGSPERFKLQPIDVKSAMASTHDFGDLADHLKSSGKQVYDRLNEVTGGQWQAADKRIETLQSKYWKAVGPEREQIGKELTSANRQMQKLFDSPKTGVSDDDLSAAKRLFRGSYLFRDLHNALEPAYQVDADFARKTGTYRGFNGSMALSRFRAQLRSNPDLRQWLGPQGADNLQQIFQYNVTMAGRKRFGEGATAVATWVAEHGSTGAGAVGAGIGALLGGAKGAAEAGLGAETVYQALKLVLHKVATDPKVGQNLIYAIEGGARPDNYGPLIGRMILQSRKYALPVAAGAIARSQ